MHEPEKGLFDRETPKLRALEYGSAAYKQSLLDLKPALDHHYKVNPHHPEYYENGINGMTLIDLVEMFADWYAATKRHATGDIYKSIVINKERFKMAEQLCSIFKNTADWIKQCE